MAILIGIFLGICALAFVLTPLIHSRDGGGWAEWWEPLWSSVGSGGRGREAKLPGPLESSVKETLTKAEYEQRPVTDNTVQTAEREQSARNALQEIELDYQLGNISEADYTLLRERYMRRALVAMKSRYEYEQELDAAIEEQLRHLKQQEEQHDAEE